MEKYYDVIIVGTGVAGCFNALHLPCDKKILMITKAKLNESDSFLAQGGICVQKSDEDYDSFFEDTMRAGHYENRKESVDIMIRSSRNVIKELIAYGVDFAISDGHYLLTKEGGVELCPVQSDYVVWACGGIGGIYEHSTNFPHLTGDALAIALRHNIELEHLDYVQIHPTTLYSKKPGRSFLISESVRGEGAKLYNKDGERFVDELLPRDVVAKAIFKQMQIDHAPNVWLSFMTIENLDVKKRFPNIYQRCLEEGYDITKEMIPVVPAQHYFMGGVHVDKNSKTSMESLYAAGETSCNGVHGANRLASNSLLESLVFAERAAVEITSLMKKQEQSGKFIGDKQQILRYYGINSEDYKDMNKRNEENKEMIWREIRKVEQHESDHRQVKCG